MDVALRDPVLAGDAAPDASGVLEAEAREVGRHEDQRLAPGVAERERARPDRVVDTLGEPVATAERHVGTEPRQMDPPETVAVGVELGNRRVVRRVCTQDRRDVDGRGAGLQLARGRGRCGKEDDDERGRPMCPRGQEIGGRRAGTNHGSILAQVYQPQN